MINQNQMFLFIMAYKKCAMWTEELESANLQINDETSEIMINDCFSFMEKAKDLIPKDKFEQAGHDFWLTRNGHGTGFWDKPKIYGEKSSQKLTLIAVNFGPYNLLADEETNQIHGF